MGLPREITIDSVSYGALAGPLGLGEGFGGGEGLKGKVTSGQKRTRGMSESLDGQ